MTTLPDRFGAGAPKLAPGWTATNLMPPSRLFGANGIRAGNDGRIYIAQLSGSRISAMDPDTGALEHLSTSGHEIVGPDDLDFDDRGNMYITEYTENRVSMRMPGGNTRVIAGDIHGSNPICWHQGRLIAGECRMGARIMEIDPDGGKTRVIVEDIPMTNAFSFGPDGKLYYPVMATSEIWRVAIDGTGRERVCGDLGVPDSVKFDAKGRIISTQVGSGEVLRIDPQSGSRTLLADIGPGLDNSTFVGDRLFVSHMTGSIHEIVAPGEIRALNPKGLLWPMGVAVADDGEVYVADGSYAYVGKPGHAMALAGMLFTPGFPEFHRGVAAAGGGQWYVTTSVGDVKLWNPRSQQCELMASGYDRLMGIAVQPGGGLVFVEAGTGRVISMVEGEEHELCTGLDMPGGVAVDGDGTVFVSESQGGRVVRLSGGRAETVIDGLMLPEGLAVHDGRVYVIDVTSRELVACDTDGASRRTIASGLPVGSPDGPRKFLGPAGGFSGPMISFAGLAAGADGTLYFGADGNGSVIAFAPPGA